MEQYLYSLCECPSLQALSSRWQTRIVNELHPFTNAPHRIFAFTFFSAVAVAHSVLHLYPFRALNYREHTPFNHALSLIACLFCNH